MKYEPKYIARSATVQSGPQRVILLLHKFTQRGKLADVAMQVGDKVRVKSGDHRGIRATVRSIRGKNLELWSEDLGITFRVPAQSVTNYSLAARKAWQTSPVRSVGRPKRHGLSLRVSVTIRIDRDLLRRLKT